MSTTVQPSAGDIERLVELANSGLSVISPFPLGVGVVNEQGEADAGSSLGPFEHLQVAIGIAERRNRAASDVHLNLDGLASLVVVETEFGQLHEYRLAI